MITKFSNSIFNELKYYVYIYSNPINGEIFYVGKGQGNRVFAHLEEEKESDKVKYINELKAKGFEPKIEILIHGLEDENTALRVESSIIDLLGITNLTNKQSGFKSATFGRMTIEQLNSTYNKQMIEITEPAILIRISKEFRYSMTDHELYEITRGFWVLNPENAKKAKYAFSIFEGIIQEIYEIADWLPAGTTESFRNLNLNIEEIEKRKKRHEFIGNIAPESIREKYKFKSIEQYFKQGNSNPIMYLNII